MPEGDKGYKPIADALNIYNHLILDLKASKIMIVEGV
jgi:hypothetical protein